MKLIVNVWAIQKYSRALEDSLEFGPKRFVGKDLNMIIDLD